MSLGGVGAVEPRGNCRGTLDGAEVHANPGQAGRNNTADSSRAREPLGPFPGPGWLILRGWVVEEGGEVCPWDMMGKWF